MPSLSSDVFLVILYNRKPLLIYSSFLVERENWYQESLGKATHVNSLRTKIWRVNDNKIHDHWGKEKNLRQLPEVIFPDFYVSSLGEANMMVISRLDSVVLRTRDKRERVPWNCAKA
jgi:hypothetical protein